MHKPGWRGFDDEIVDEPVVQVQEEVVTETVECQGCGKSVVKSISAQSYADPSDYSEFGATFNLYLCSYCSDLQSPDLSKAFQE